MIPHAETVRRVRDAIMDRHGWVRCGDFRNNYERKRPGQKHGGEVRFNPEKMYVSALACPQGHSVRYLSNKNCVICGRGRGFYMVGIP